MDVARKVIGALILITVSIPPLSAVIWASGLTRAVVSEEFLAEIPREVIRQAPEMANELFDAAKQPGAVEDENARAWVEAAAKLDTTPAQMLEASGVSGWLDSEVSKTIDDVGQALRGEIAPSSVVLDLKPLKKALSNDAMRDYGNRVMANLPMCDSQRLKEWRNAILGPGRVRELPACNPGGTITGSAIDLILSSTVDIPDEAPVFENTDIPPGLDIPGALGGFIWLMFLFPALLILLGAAVADTTPRGFLRWSGGATLAGGVVPLLTSSLVQASVLAFLKVDPSWWEFGSRTKFWTSEASRIVAERVSGILKLLVEQLFSPVTEVAFVVCAVGLLLIGLSFIVGSDEKN